MTDQVQMDDSAKISSKLPREIQQRGIVRVVGTCGTAPLRSLDPDSGATIGCEVDLAHLFAEVLGLTVEFDTATWSECLAQIDSGAADMIISDAVVTDRLAEKYDFATYRADLIALRVRSDDSGSYAGRQDLAGKVIAVDSRPGLEQLLDRWNSQNVQEGLKAITIEHLGDSTNPVEALATGCVDGYLGSYARARHESMTAGSTEILHILPRPDDDRGGTIGVLTRRGGGLIGPLAEAINHTIRNGPYRRVLDRWHLGEEAVAYSEIMPPERTGVGHLARARILLVLATLAIAAMIVLLEIDRILGAVTVDGRSHTMGAVFGPVSGLSAAAAAFNDWATVSGVIPIRHLVITYLVVDLAFIGIYCGLLVGFRERLKYAWTGGRAPKGSERGWLIAWPAIVWLAVADLAEDGFTLGLAVSLPSQPLQDAVWAASQWLTVPLFVFTWAKRLGVLVVTGSMIYGLVTLPRAKERWRRWVVAVKMQRFSLILVILMSVLMIFPGPNIFDQASDIERTWLLDGTWTTGLRHFLGAFLAFGLLTLLLVRLGDLRSVRARTIYPDIEPGTTAPKPDNRRPSKAKWWLFTAGAIAGVGFVLWLTGLARPNVPALSAVVAVPAVIGALDWFVNRRSTPEVGQNPLVYPGAARSVQVVGDVVALSVGAVLGLSMVRAFTVPAVLDIERGLALTGLIGGLLLAAAVWVLSATWIRRRFQATMGSAGDPGKGWPVASWLRSLFDVENPRKFVKVASISALIVLLLPLWLPHWFAGTVGVLGVFAWGLSAMALILMVLATLAQSRRPLKIFRILGLDATPMISLVLAAAVVASLVGGSGLTHQVRYPGTALTNEAQQQWKDRTFEESVATWLDKAAGSHCSIESAAGSRTVHIKPMIFVAATGGGIRAAWWTVRAASELATSTCGNQAVIAASGASGGAVGLALMYSSQHPVDDARTLATANPLSVTTDGLILRDVVSGFTGLDLASLDRSEPDRYPDRAGLMEQAWEAAIPAFAQHFPATGKPTGTVPWHVFLNSTSARTGCRVVIGDVSTRSGAPGTPAVDDAEGSHCERTGGESGIAGSYDLFAAQPCLLGLRTSTAALLASRFPYVTPSGVLTGECVGITGSDADLSDQLIDGGYAENSGIGTLIDLGDQAMPQVRAFNERQLSSDGDITVVVPMVISLENTPQATTTQSTNGPEVGEALVPVLSGLRRGATLNDPPVLLDRLTTTTSDWLPQPSVCPRDGCDPLIELADQVRAAAAGALPDRSLVVAPSSAPGVAAPLGWVMSKASLDEMDKAMGKLRPCPAESPLVDCRFDRLLNSLQERST